MGRRARMATECGSEDSVDEARGDRIDHCVSRVHADRQRPRLCRADGCPRLRSDRCRYRIDRRPHRARATLEEVRFERGSTPPSSSVQTQIGALSLPMNLVVVTNILTPYRIPLFEAMRE